MLLNYSKTQVFNAGPNYLRRWRFEAWGRIGWRFSHVFFFVVVDFPQL